MSNRQPKSTTHRNRNHRYMDKTMNSWTARFFLRSLIVLAPALAAYMADAAEPRPGTRETPTQENLMSQRITGIRRLEETTWRVKGQGDNWHMTWADDDKQYVGLCDGGGLPGTSGGNSRVIIASGNPPKVTFGNTPVRSGETPSPADVRSGSMGSGCHVCGFHGNGQVDDERV